MSVIPFPSQRSRNRTKKPVRRKPKANGDRKRGNAEMRKALKELQSHARSTVAMMYWLRQIARADPDPRAILALIDTDEGAIFSDVDLIGTPQEAKEAVNWLAKFVREYRKEQRNE